MMRSIRFLPSLTLVPLLLAPVLPLVLGCGGGSGGESQALVLALAQFAAKGATGGAPQPLPAGLEFLVQQDDGSWKLHTAADPESNVFHKAMAYTDGGVPKLLTAGGTAAALKLWTVGANGELEADKEIWKKDFGGKFSRMRDVEVADLFGDGRASMAIATHDQGVVATAHPDGSGGFTVARPTPPTRRTGETLCPKTRSGSCSTPASRPSTPARLRPSHGRRRRI